MVRKEVKYRLDLSEISFDNCTDTHTTFILLFTCLIISYLSCIHTLSTLWLNSLNNIYTHTLVTVFYINPCVFKFSITLSKMIALQQWRMAIDCFHPCGFKSGCTNEFPNGKFSFRGKMSFILVISIISLLLLMAGDVELNPGPSRKCPHCQFEIPICQKKCEHCGLLVKLFKSNEKKLNHNTQYCQKNVVHILAKQVESYKSNPEKQKALSKSSYRSNPEKQKALSKLSYRANTEKFKSAFKMNYAKNRDARIKSVKSYYTDNKKTKCANKRNKYVLADSKLYVKE